jgi:hypothetical protein
MIRVLGSLHQAQQGPLTVFQRCTVSLALSSDPTHRDSIHAWDTAGLITALRHANPLCFLAFIATLGIRSDVSL